MNSPSACLALRVAAAVVAGLAAFAVHADTFGYLCATLFEREVALPLGRGESRVVVARSPDEWSAAFGKAGGAGTALPVDFERDMVVGVVNGQGEDRVVYRIQLDRGADPRALEVHLGTSDAPKWAGSTHPRVGAHFVVTPRSALPVRFVMDEMVDVMMFGMTNTGEGVESREVAVVAGSRGEAAGRAALREDAERAVVAALTPAERAKLLRGPIDTLLARIPHGWMHLEVARLADRWSIRYDDLAFEVDVATGKVTRR